MPGRQLASFVHVADEGGDIHVFGPGDDVPGWAQKAISNPKAWADQPAAGGGAGAATVEEPPRSGAGSGKDAWAAYAATRGVDVPADATRDQIIDLVDAQASE